MKRLIFLIVILSLSSHLQAQAWRDSLNQARKYYKGGNYGLAEKKYLSAQKHAPEGVDLSAELGQNAMRLRDFDKAEKYYKESIGREENNSLRSIKGRNLGNTQMAQKKYDEAIESYKDALRLNPNDEKTRYNLSEAIRRKKKEDQKKQEQDQQNQDQQKQQNQDQQNGESGKNDQNKQNQNSNGKQQQNKNGQSQQNGEQKSGNGDKQSGANEKSKLSNKKVDKLLDDLMKQESFTRQKGRGTQSEQQETKSGKDW